MQITPAAKNGIKVWERGDSTNGYVCKFEVYVGKQQGGQRETNVESKVVKRLTRHLKGKNHHIYFDNYFNNIAFNSITGQGTDGLFLFLPEKVIFHLY